MFYVLLLLPTLLAPGTSKVGLTIADILVKHDKEYVQTIKPKKQESWIKRKWKYYKGQ